MRRCTFDQKYAAHTVKGGSYVFIPDQVFDNQHDFDGKSFPAMRQDGTRVRAVLRGELYGLGTTGVGDPVVSIGN